MNKFIVARRPVNLQVGSVVSFWAGKCPCILVGFSRDLPRKHPLRRQWGEDVVLVRKVSEEKVSAGIFAQVWNNQILWFEVSPEEQAKLIQAAFWAYIYSKIT